MSKGRTVPIDWSTLEIAVERNGPNTESYLDLTTGQVISMVAGDPDTPLRKQQVASNIENFVRIEPASSRDQYRWMERYVMSVPDDALRQRLIISIDGKGAFRRFKDVLLAYPADREKWFSYRSEHLRWHIHNWLKDVGIVPTSPPLWGEATEPVELQPAAPAVPPSVEAPGEALRRQARELIDGIAAIDLPSALAFLEFLRERGRDALLGDDAIEEPAQADDGDISNADRRRFAG